MIRFVGTHKVYRGRREALRNVSFEIGRGELVFLTGHSGAGKTTVLRLIALIERPTRGQVVVDGCNLERMKARDIPYYRRSVGVVFQDHRLVEDRSVAENVALPLSIAGVPREESDRRVRAALDQVGLLGKERYPPAELSTGEQQRVGIARAVVHKPVILLADEPTGNLDPELSREIMALFDRFRQVGTTVVVATHDLERVRGLPGRVMVLKDGELVQGASPRAA